MAEMKRLILLCLLSPAIFAWPHKIKDPNDDPFLPVHPIYSYNPKLIKRGSEAEVNSQLTSKLHAPKIDAKDSSSYSSKYQRDSYYPNYNFTNNTPFVYPSYYNGGEAYVYGNAPYPGYNLYSVPYTVNPTSHPVSPYPNYYYQPHYYYPHYFNHALFPPPSQSGIYYQETPQVPQTPNAESDKQNADKKGEKEVTSQDVSANQFVDGGNYIAGNSRDLDVQSTYKVASPYNQLAQNVEVKNLLIPLPKVTYRLINVGQPVSQDYLLPAAYVKAQQIEQMTSQTLADLLAQNAQQQAGSSYESNRDTSNGDGSYENQEVYNPNAQSYINLSGAKSKTGVAYVIDSVGIPKINGEHTKQQNLPTQKVSSKNTKYSNAYSRKPVSRNHSQVSYASPESGSNHHARVTSTRPAGQADKQYSSYDASQSYGGTYSQTGNKQEQNYETQQNQAGSYQNEGFNAAPQTTRSHIYYSAYESDQQSLQDEIDGKFGTKHRE